MHMKSINNISLVKTIIEHVMRTRVLGRPIVFLRVRCSIPYCNWQIFCVLVVFSENGSYCNSFGIEVPTFSTGKLYINKTGVVHINVMLRRVRATVGAVQKKYLHILSVP